MQMLKLIDQPTKTLSKVFCNREMQSGLLTVNKTLDFLFGGEMIIYKIENKINGKIYIGQTIKTIEQRLKGHFICDSFIGRALRKDGIENFDMSVIDESDSKEWLDDKENYWICFHDCKDPNGYNLTDGGEGVIGHNHSEETKQKQRLAKLGKKQSLATIEKKSLIMQKRWQDPDGRKRMSENNPGMTGKHHTEQTKEQIRQKKIGQKASEGTKEKCRIINSNPEVKKRQSDTQKEVFARPGVKENHSNKIKEKWADPVYKEKQHKAHLGIKQSEETKIKKNKSLTNKKRTKEACENMKKAQIKRRETEVTNNG